MNGSLKVIALNIEFDRHLETVIPFLKSEPWDLLLLNEILEENLGQFETELGTSAFFRPTMKLPRPTGDVTLGSAVMCRFPVNQEVIKYAGSEGETLEVITDIGFHAPKLKYFLFVSSVEKDGDAFQIGFTHFPWTKDGEADEYQRQAMDALLIAVQKKGEMALFGDFNIPRGKELYHVLLKEFKDNIPSEYKTSLDENKHRVGVEHFREQKMDTYVVDYCFTTPNYSASDVSLRFGISDHAAVLATVSKKLI